jgi:hypothetical protein
LHSMLATAYALAALHLLWSYAEAHQRMHAWVDDTFMRTLKWCSQKWPRSPQRQRSFLCLSPAGGASPQSSTCSNISTRSALARSLSLGSFSPLSFKSVEGSLMDSAKGQEPWRMLPCTIPEADEDGAPGPCPPAHLIRTAVDMMLGRSFSTSAEKGNQLTATAAPPNTPRQSTTSPSDPPAPGMLLLPTADTFTSKATAPPRVSIFTSPMLARAAKMELTAPFHIHPFVDSSATQELTSPPPSCAQALGIGKGKPLSLRNHPRWHKAQVHTSNTAFLSPRVSVPQAKGKSLPLRSAVSAGANSPIHDVYHDILREISGQAAGRMSAGADDPYRISCNSSDLAAMCLPSVSLTVSEMSYLIAAQHDWHEHGGHATSGHPYPGISSQRGVLVE